MKELARRGLNWFKQLKLWKKISFAGLLVAILLPILLYFMVLVGFFGKVPNKRDLRNLDESSASEVYGFDQTLVATIYHRNRSYVPYDSLPSHLTEALLATEDERYWQHGGIDFRSLGRVFLKTVLMGEDAGGGSTLNMQLAKNVFGRKSGHSYFRLVVTKLKEMIAAKRLNRLYSKEKIVELYLNTVPFGENVYGIEAASQRFFHRSVAQLEIHQSALLVGMLKANTSYNPRLHPEASRERRNVVFSQLVRNEKLNTKQYDSLAGLPIELDYWRDQSPYYRPHYVNEIEKETTQLLKGQKKRNGDAYDPRRDGLKIYTSIHPLLQKTADSVMQAHLAYLQKQLYRDWGRVRPWGRKPEIINNAIKQSTRYSRLAQKGLSHAEILAEMKKKQKLFLFENGNSGQRYISPIDSIKIALMQLKSGFLAIDNENASVIAWVGSPDIQLLQFDYVKAKRQVASTFKPIVFATALEQGYAPCEYFRNVQLTYQDYNDWKPANFDHKYGGRYSMKGALTHSVNVVAVDLLYKAKLENVIEQAERMGISSDMPDFPSLALGVADISLKEMVQAYSVFPNEGKLRKLHLINRIEDKNGKVLYQHREKAQRAMGAEEARMMVNMLVNAVENGTGRSLSSRFGINEPLAGKTGTAQSHSDGWFIGFNKRITAGVWVGADLPSIGFRNASLGQGSKMALPIFAGAYKSMMAQGLNTFTNAAFTPLEPDLAEELSCEDFIEDSGWDKFINSFRRKEFSDNRLERRNRRNRFWRSIFGKD